MRLLITGGSGYIASRFVEVVTARPGVEEILVLDLRAPEAPPPKVRFVERSVTEDLRDLFTDPARPVDVALHLAWNVDPLRDSRRQRRISIGGTRRFLEGCAAGGVEHLLFMSSATAYGAGPDHATPLAESEPPRDHRGSQYAAEKAEGEELCRRFAAERPGTLLQIVRPAIVGGPNVSNFIFRWIEKPIFFLPRGLDPAMQFVHEDDVARALSAIVDSKAEGAWNVAPDDTLTVRRAVAIAASPCLTLPLVCLYSLARVAWTLDLKQVIEAPAPFLNYLAYPWLVSNRRIREELGFEFRYGSQETLESFLAARRDAARPQG